MKKTKLFFWVNIIFTILCFGHSYAENELNISPIVQVISYSDIYGKYPQMMGWGSASIINKDGIILSNDHVVDAGNGALASAFSVCITKETFQKPVCDYTASLIARNDKLDVSILKIDPKDIYGNVVDYSKFKTIDVDYDYQPKSQDEAIAIGYPWVGADTISETKGIISGVSEYNGYQYMKTDTLIAGGNSGGAFVKDGKLIGIPTFGMGGYGENSMGYALLIKEAQNFIQENISKSPSVSTITSLIDFNSYRKNIENINNSGHLQDDVFDIHLGDDYKISNYIKNTYFTIELKKQKDTGVTLFGVYLEKAPQINTDTQKFYYFESKGLYSKDSQKLITKNIGGVNFYYPVDKTDLSNGNSNWGNNYFTIENGYLINMYLQAPFYDEKRNTQVKQEVEKVLNFVKINTTHFSQIQSSFSTNIPKIEIQNVKNAISDTGKYKFYLGNLYENFEIYLNELVEYNGKGKTAQEIYDVELKDVDDSMKSMIHFHGLDGFIYCGNDASGNYYNYYNYYGGNNITYDDNGNPIVLQNCEINLYFPLNKELNRQNYLSLKLTSLKNTQTKNLDLAILFLKKYLKIDETDDKVDIPNILKNQIQLHFQDLSNQTKEYKNFLTLLIRYKMINNTNYFGGNNPITWGDFLNMYSKYVYNFPIDTPKCKMTDYTCKFEQYTYNHTSLDSIFKSLGIDNYNDYIDSSKITNFDVLFRYKLAGVDLKGGYTMTNILTFQHLIDEEENTAEKQKINAFNYSIFGTKKILLSDFYSNYNTTYFRGDIPTYYPDKKLLIYTKSTPDIIHLGNTQSNEDKELITLAKTHQCYSKGTYKAYSECTKDYETKYQEIVMKYHDTSKLEGENSFTPLTKAEALNIIFSQVDFSLFDDKLKEKKGTVIETGSGNTDE